MGKLEKSQAWAAAFAMICLLSVPLAWFGYRDSLTRWFLVGWIVFCVGMTWLSNRFNWTGRGGDDYPYNMTWDEQSHKWVSATKARQP